MLLRMIIVRTLVVGLVVAPIAGCMSGCSPGNAGTDVLAKGPPKVTVVSPERRTLSETIEQPARIEAFEQTPIQVKIPGYVQKVCVEIGQHVRAGELLAELRVPEVVEEHELKVQQV